MGKLTLTLRAGADSSPDRGPLLARFRTRGAQLVGSHVGGTDDAPTEVYEFTTTTARRRKGARRRRSAVGSLADQQARLERLEAAASLGVGLSGQPLPLDPPKEESVKKVSVRTLTLGTHEAEARQIYTLAKRLVRGEGPPDELRMPRPTVTIVPCGSEERPRDAWGVGGVGVAIEMRRPYPATEAMVVAGYILLGLEWPQRYRALRLPAALDAAYAALERHFEAPATSVPEALVTLPKPALPKVRRGRKSPALANGRPDAPALPAPTPQQLPPPTEPESSSSAEEGSPS